MALSVGNAGGIHQKLGNPERFHEALRNDVKEDERMSELITAITDAEVNKARLNFGSSAEHIFLSDIIELVMKEFCVKVEEALIDDEILFDEGPHQIKQKIEEKKDSLRKLREELYNESKRWDDMLESTSKPKPANTRTPRSFPTAKASPSPTPGIVGESPSPESRAPTCLADRPFADRTQISFVNAARPPSIASRISSHRPRSSPNGAIRSSSFAWQASTSSCGTSPKRISPPAAPRLDAPSATSSPISSPTGLHAARFPAL